MNAYDAAEQGFKNGYNEGYNKGHEDGYKKGYEDALLEVDVPGTGVWKWTKEGDKICSNCGMLEPDCLPGACVIWPQEKRYCFYCGTRLLQPEDLS